MDWKQLISNQRLGQEHRHTERHDDRTEFKRDYDRLIFSAPFRRLQNKTQVFPLPGSIFVHNRLTHSLEVASVGMSLGNDVAQRIIQEKRPELRGTMFEQIGQIVSTACLAHDLGNPPFGHSGEKAIQTFFTEGAGNALKSQVSPEFWDDITHQCLPTADPSVQGSPGRRFCDDLLYLGKHREISLRLFSRQQEGEVRFLSE